MSKSTEKLYKIENGQLVEVEPPTLDQQLAKRAYTSREAEKILNLGRNTVNGLLLSGRLKAVKVGKKWLIPNWAIDEFLTAK